MTRGQRSLEADGNAEVVLHSRRAFQDTMKDAIAAIEGRPETVVVFMSNHHTDPDLAVEVFILEPKASDGCDEPEEMLNEPRT